jgi:hypothetical protein
MDGDRPQNTSDTSSSWQFKPGNTIDPSGVLQTQEVQTPNTESTPIISSDVQAASPKPNPVALSVAHTDSDSKDISWSASEFIAHNKSFGWYMFLILAAVLVGGLVYLLTKDKISASVVLVVAFFLAITASHKPRTLDYKLDSSGLTIGNKTYEYTQFRSFAVVEEGAFSSIIFTPLKRFMPLITIYYEPNDEDAIVNILSNRLPLETHHLDMIEQFMRKIRF